MSENETNMDDQSSAKSHSIFEKANSKLNKENLNKYAKVTKEKSVKAATGLQAWFSGLSNFMAGGMLVGLGFGFIVNSPLGGLLVGIGVAFICEQVLDSKSDS